MHSKITDVIKVDTYEPDNFIREKNSTEQLHLIEG